MMAARSNNFRSKKKSTTNAEAATDAMLKTGLAEVDGRTGLTLNPGRESRLKNMRPKSAASKITRIGLNPIVNTPIAIAAITTSVKPFKDVLPNDTVAFATMATTMV